MTDRRWLGKGRSRRRIFYLEFLLDSPQGNQPAFPGRRCQERLQFRFQDSRIHLRRNGNGSLHDDFLQEQFLVCSLLNLGRKRMEEEVGENDPIKGGGQGDGYGGQDRRRVP